MFLLVIFVAYWLGLGSSAVIEESSLGYTEIINRDDEIMTNREIKNEPVSSLRDLNKFPSCVTDEDCELIEDNENSEYRCFQYMCYPWAKKGPFRSCQRKHDCKDLTPEEGGNGERVDCFRHLDRRRVLRGICLVNRFENCQNKIAF